MSDTGLLEAIEAAIMMMEGSEGSDTGSEFSIVPDSEPEEGLLSLPTQETQTPEALRELREMFEGTQPSFMQDATQTEEEDSVGSVHIRSDSEAESGREELAYESGGYTSDVGDSDSE